MIQIDKQLFDMYRSLEKLESLDKHYYKKEDFDSRSFRLNNKINIIDSFKYLLFDNSTKNIHNYLIRDIPTIKELDYIYSRVGLIDTLTCYRYQDSFRKKTSRLRKRINRLFMYDNLFFLTFTFDDRKLKKKDVSKVKQETLRKYVNRWLNTYSIDYVGNVDFGSKNGRIHFHCIVATDFKKVDGNTWCYGALNIKKINNKNDKDLATYINKLCSHSLKESTKNQYLLYPRLKYKKNIDNFP